MIRLRAITTLALAVGCAALLHRSAPTDGPWRAPLPWIEAHGATAFAIEVARVAAIALSLYVALVATLVALHPPRALPAPALLRRALGLALVGTVAVPTTAFATTPSTDPPVLVLVEPAPTPSTAPSTVPPAPERPPPQPPAPPPTDVAAAPTWRVAPGDCFWTIAEQVVGTDDVATVHVYWRALVRANLDRLVVPGNPDLVHPGQELVLPPR
jgi:nucleoid-associated protein YgaU